MTPSTKTNNCGHRVASRVEVRSSIFRGKVSRGVSDDEKNHLFPTFARLAGGGAEVSDGTADWRAGLVNGVWPEKAGIVKQN